MHIPDDWNRGSSKNRIIPSVSKQPTQIKADTVVPVPKVEIDSTTIKKRKRMKTATVAQADVADIKEHDDKSVRIDMDVTDVDMISKQPIPPTTPQTKMQSVPRHCDETESVIRGLYYQVEKLSRRPGCVTQEGIHLDSIMTHIPYIEVLQQMFGGTAVKNSPCVPVVTRSYEESYMREALSGVENGCVMGSNCECQFIDEHNPFIGVQFTLPVEALANSNACVEVVEELTSNQLCVLCCRKNTQSLFYEAIYNHRAYNGCIQLYGNICDRPGEYAKEAMLICPLSGPMHNMPLPVVAHQRNRYGVVIHNGIKQLRQYRVGYEDFHVPSSSRC